MGYQDSTPRTAFEGTKARIMRRRSLYRSLARRGLVRSDPSLKQIDGSLYASIRRFLEDHEQSDPAAQENVNNWYDICVEIYADPELQEPPAWGKFLSTYKRHLGEVDDEGEVNGNALMNIADLLMDALGNFPMELMAVDDSSLMEDDDDLDI